MSSRPIITPEELSLSENCLFNERQLNFIFSKTPSKYIGKRGGQDYVKAAYVKKVLNVMFGWRWSNYVVSKEVMLEYGETIAVGRVIAHTPGGDIVHEHVGNNKIVFFKQFKDKIPKEPHHCVSIGYDLKGAVTDSIKKSANLFGVCDDVYYSKEFKEVKVDNVSLTELSEKFKETREFIGEALAANIVRIIDDKEEESYNKAYVELKKANK